MKSKSQTKNKIQPTAAILIAALVLLPVAALAGNAERISLSSSGEEGNGNSGFSAVISASGRYVAFSSWASNLVADDTNGTIDVFVRDLANGTTKRISVDGNGAQVNLAEAINGLAISADGRYIVIAAKVSGVGDNVYVHDQFTGETQRGPRMSDGISIDDSARGRVGISENGRFVVFGSPSSGLVPGDSNGYADVFMYDRMTGLTERVSVASDGTQANNESFSMPAISADGRFVAFWSKASNIVAGDSNNAPDVFVRDRLTGSTKRVSVASDGTQGNGESSYPHISADGRFVAFWSASTNFDTKNVNGIFLHDLWTTTTDRVSTAATNSKLRDLPAGLSADGRYVIFTSPSMFGGCANSYSHAYGHDHLTGTTLRLDSVDNGSECYEGRAQGISAGGHTVVFSSLGPNLVPDDTNGVQDVFVRSIPLPY